MLVVETIVRIRREHASGKGIKTIARDLRLSRKVVRKAIRATVVSPVGAGRGASARKPCRLAFNSLRPLKRHGDFAKVIDERA